MDGTHNPPPSLSIETINGVKFTPREIDVLACILGGRATKKIASFLSVSAKTVENHIYHIMLKLECNSRESIKDFLESSDEILFLKNHYDRLSFQEGFERKLKEISAHNLQERPRCLFIYGVEDKNNTSLFSQLEKHLKLAGVIVTLDVRKELWTENTLKEAVESSSQDFRLLFIPQALKNSLQIEKNKSKQIIPQFSEEEAKQQKTFLFLLRTNNKKTFIHFPEFAPHQHASQKNYYLSLIEILKSLLPKHNFDDLLSKIEKYDNGRIENYSQSQKSKIQNNQDNKNKVFNLRKWHVVLLVSFVVIVFIYWEFGAKIHNTAKQGEHFIRSDLITPQKNILLDRPEIIAEIDKKFTDQSGIQTVALIGTGGAGKTTLARQYAQQQKTNIMWEINVETQETLKDSFEKLARYLAKTEEVQKVLREIQDIKNFKEKEEKILEFVKKNLKLNSHWLLIYDNVEHFSDIQKYFPHDNESWGTGKIILTTRNTNIQNNSQISRMIPIGELTQEQKLELFTKIISHGVPASTATQNTETIKFLESIPPFPLDISVAAYYLKSTNMSYKKYLENLENYNKDFDSVQKNLLKEAGTYLKTRYSIITQSLEYLIKSHKDFGELLLFISLLDSQNIPRDLLNKHKNEPVVDNFIYHLKKYSIITNESADSVLGATVSIHRSTQAIILAYLIKELSLLKNNNTLQEICNIFIKYTVDAIAQGDFMKQKCLLNHCVVVLSHKNLLTDFMKASISGELGGIYCHQGLYVKAKKILEETLQHIDKKHHILRAHISIYLGKFYSSTGNYEKARALFDNNITIYNKYDKNNIDFPTTLTYLGILYRKIGDYKKAEALITYALKLFKINFSEDYGPILWASINLGNIYLEQGNFEKARVLLEQNLKMYKQYFPSNHGAIAEILQRLGVIYRDLGYYDKAIDLFQLCLKNYKRELSETHLYIASPLVYLGSVYIELKKYEEAKKILEKSLSIYNKHASENHIHAALALGYLGNAHIGLKNHQTAKHYLQKNLKIYEDQFGKAHLKTAYILRDLGRVYLLEDHIETAEKFFDKALGIFQQSEHPELYSCLENLSDLYQKKSEHAKNSGFSTQSQNFNKQGSRYLKQALEIVKTHFPADSPHRERIQTKLKSLE